MLFVFRNSYFRRPILGSVLRKSYSDGSNYNIEFTFIHTSSEPRVWNDCCATGGSPAASGKWFYDFDI
jgi:hypothetical protein